MRYKKRGLSYILSDLPIVEIISIIVIFVIFLGIIFLPKDIIYKISVLVSII